MADRHTRPQGSRSTSWIRRVGRMLLASQFVYGGYKAAKDPGRRPHALEKAGVPGGADLVRFNGAAMAAGGIALGLGIFPRLAAAGLFASLVPTTLVGHPFWREEEPAARQAQTVQFLKNASMLGGLLLELGSRRGEQPGARRAAQPEIGGGG
ncbi:MAG TPA: DoxX family protein [Acidimicrobiales bacterium]|nr:DoxX family protein [Acidimicrobiales bacterium]